MLSATLLLATLATPALAAPDTAATDSKDAPDDTPTATSTVQGDAVYQHCVACHGKRGAGGEGGRYPRIAGLPVDYIDRQLHDFKQQRRINKPMLPIFNHHRFDDGVIRSVAETIAAMPTPDLALWPYQPDPAALAVFDSRSAFAAAGAERYAAACATCHGADGNGADAPPLTAQYPAYLQKQMQDFATNQRRHAASIQCGSLDAIETEAVINHLVELAKD